VNTALAIVGLLGWYGIGTFALSFVTDKDDPERWVTIIPAAAIWPFALLVGILLKREERSNSC
jgi:hypothetical protein